MTEEHGEFQITRPGIFQKKCRIKDLKIQNPVLFYAFGFNKTIKSEVHYGIYSQKT